MRIVGGRHKGRTLAAPPGRATRPTADRAREALFNVLVHGHDVAFADIAVVDCFAGSGALGLEAASRGARQVFFIENDRRAAETLRSNVHSMNMTNTQLLCVDATRPPAAETPCGLALLDPPYGSGLAGACLTALRARGWLATDAVVVVEVAAKEALEPPEGFEAVDERIYGAARFVFLRPLAPAAT